MFKFNLVKIEKAIVYQPISVDPETWNLLFYKHKCYEFVFDGIVIRTDGYPEIAGNDKIELWLGLRDIESIGKSDRISIKHYISNDERDFCYGRIVNCIPIFLEFLRNSEPIIKSRIEIK